MQLEPNVYACMLAIMKPGSVSGMEREKAYLHASSSDGGHDEGAFGCHVVLSQLEGLLHYLQHAPPVSCLDFHDATSTSLDHFQYYSLPFDARSFLGCMV